MNSNNVFLFLKASPIVEVMGVSECKVVGTITKHSVNLRQRVVEVIKKQNKIVNLKFETLNREGLDNIRNYGCRVLYL